MKTEKENTQNIIDRCIWHTEICLCAIKQDLVYEENFDRVADIIDELMEDI